MNDVRLYQNFHTTRSLFEQKHSCMRLLSFACCTVITPREEQSGEEARKWRRWSLKTFIEVGLHIKKGKRQKHPLKSLLNHYLLSINVSDNLFWSFIFILVYFQPIPLIFIVKSIFFYNIKLKVVLSIPLFYDNFDQPTNFTFSPSISFFSFFFTATCSSPPINFFKQSISSTFNQIR